MWKYPRSSPDSGCDCWILSLQTDIRQAVTEVCKTDCFKWLLPIWNQALQKGWMLLPSWWDTEGLSAAPHVPVQLTVFSHGSAACTVRQLKVRLGLQVRAACKQKGCLQDKRKENRYFSFWNSLLLLSRKGMDIGSSGIVLVGIQSAVIPTVVCYLCHVAPSLSIKINTHLKLVAKRISFVWIFWVSHSYVSFCFALLLNFLKDLIDSSSQAGWLPQFKVPVRGFSEVLWQLMSCQMYKN